MKKIPWAFESVDSFGYLPYEKQVQHLSNSSHKDLHFEQAAG
jgi:hypothetical protein